MVEKVYKDVLNKASLSERFFDAPEYFQNFFLIEPTVLTDSSTETISSNSGGIDFSIRSAITSNTTPATPKAMGTYMLRKEENADERLVITAKDRVIPVAP